MQFESVGDDRTRLTVTSLVSSFAERDAILARGMEHGVREGYEKLDELLNKQASPERPSGPGGVQAAQPICP